MNTLALETLPSISLDNVTGGAGAGVNANVDVKGDVNEAIRDVGSGLQRVIGCGFGASSPREFGNCILTGKLGDVPPPPSSN